jgi:hypothetical protein
MGGPVFLSGLILGMISGFLVGSRGGAAKRAWKDHRLAKDGERIMRKAKWPPTRAALVAWAIFAVVILTATGYFTGSQ